MVNFFFSLLLQQKSALEQDILYIDADTKDMLKALNFENISGVEVQQVRS